MRIASRSIDHVEVRLNGLIRSITPAAAGAVNQVIMQKAILKREARGFLQPPVVRCWYGLATIRKTRNRHSHQGECTFSHFGTPHAVATRFGSHQNVQMLIFTLEERELLDRAS